MPQTKKQSTPSEILASGIALGIFGVLIGVFPRYASFSGLGELTCRALAFCCFIGASLVIAGSTEPTKDSPFKVLMVWLSSMSVIAVLLHWASTSTDNRVLMIIMRALALIAIAIAVIAVADQLPKSLGGAQQPSSKGLQEATAVPPNDAPGHWTKPETWAAIIVAILNLAAAIFQVVQVVLS